MPYPHLTKAPVNEALVDIQFQLPADTKTPDLLAWHSKVIAQYPDKKERRRWQGNIQFGPAMPPSTVTEDLGVEGYQFWAKDKTQVVQVRLNGFTFSRLRPYEDWEHLVAEGRRLWMLFLETFRPGKITRVAVRFINEMPIPLPINGFRQYLTMVPRPPDDQSYILTSFLYRQVIEDPSSDASIIITNAMEPPTGTKVKILLDIDAFKSVVNDVSPEKVWEMVDSLREIKNKFFFSSITEKTVELFK